MKGLLFAAGACLAGVGSAMPARPVWFDYELEGCTVKLQNRGNGFKHWTVTEDLYSLCRQEEGYVFRMENGECSSEKLSCDQLAPSFNVKKNVPGQTKGRKSEELAERGGPPSFVEQQIGKMRDNLKDAVRAAHAGQPNPHAHGRRELQTTTVRKNLVLMIRWADHSTKALPTTSQLNNLFNAPSTSPSQPPTGSIRQYYLDQSLGQFQLDNVLSGWIDSTYTERQAAGEIDGTTGEPCQALCNANSLQDAIIEAIDNWAATTSEPFAQFDADNDGYIDVFTIIHSGYGAEIGSNNGGDTYRIWSHKYALFPEHTATTGGLKFFLYNISPSQYGNSEYGLTNVLARIGVIAHEIAHYLGLPDLYDIDYTSSGLSYHDIMADSWGADSSQNFPSSFSAMSKIMLGWLTPTVIVENPGNNALSLGPYQSTGEVLALALSNTDLSTLTDQQWKAQFSNLELLLLENRRPVGVDSLLGGGVLIWHIDYGKIFASSNGFVYSDQNCNKDEFQVNNPGTWTTNHYGIRLVQADQLFQLESGGSADNDDFFLPGDSFGDSNSPNINTYANAAAGTPSGREFHSFSANANTMTFTLTTGTAEPTPNPSKAPSKSPTPLPTSNPSVAPSQNPTKAPTSIPTRSPLPFGQTHSPSSNPTTSPSAAPTSNPTSAPTAGSGGGTIIDQFLELDNTLKIAIGAGAGLVVLLSALCMCRLCCAKKREPTAPMGSVVGAYGNPAYGGSPQYGKV